MDTAPLRAPERPAVRPWMSMIPNCRRSMSGSSSSIRMMRTG